MGKLQGCLFEFLLTRELVTCSFKLGTRGFELATHGLELVIYGFELVTC